MDFVSTMSGCRVGYMTLTIKSGEDLAGLEGPKLNGIVTNQRKGLDCGYDGVLVIQQGKCSNDGSVLGCPEVTGASNRKTLCDNSVLWYPFIIPHVKPLFADITASFFESCRI